MITIPTGIWLPQKHTNHTQLHKSNVDFLHLVHDVLYVALSRPHSFPVCCFVYIWMSDACSLTYKPSHCSTQRMKITCSHQVPIGAHAVSKVLIRQTWQAPQRQALPTSAGLPPGQTRENNPFDLTCVAEMASSRIPFQSCLLYCV